MRHLSLFNGIGGFQLAAHWCGWQNIAHVEIDDFCNRVVARHFPQSKCYKDIRAFDGTEYREKIDVLLGGFPCQDISQAGQKKGITPETRSGLWFEMLRVIRDIRPRYVLIENVSALLNRGMGVVLRDLAKIRYDAEWQCISASEVGAWHKRERVWIVAYPQGKRLYRLDTKQQKRCAKEYMESDFSLWRCSFELPVELEWPHSNPRSGVRRNDDGLSEGMDNCLKALGNAIVPQVAYQIFKAENLTHEHLRQTNRCQPRTIKGKH